MNNLQRSVLFAASMLACASNGGSLMAADTNMIRATCNQDGMIVHREDIPADASAERRLMIAAKKPKAMCVFLKIADHPPEYRAPSTVPSDMLPSEILSAAASTGNSEDVSLAAALNVLSGRSDDEAGSDIPQFSNAYTTPMTMDTILPKASALNLTIGLYKNLKMEDVIAHWKLMQQGTKVLATMTPSMAVTGDITMLSIEDVPDSQAAALCEEAAKNGSGCIAVY